MSKNGLIIRGTEEGSIARKLKIDAGDKLVTINGVYINDIIDYVYNCAGDVIDVVIQKRSGRTHRYKIHKRYDKTLGILFEDTITATPKRCRNHCTFCFVDQMPVGLRESLYIKDDDYRLSFLDGNFITLTNLNQDDINRIINYHLSPLYISVHATDIGIRNYLLGRKKVDHDIMEMLKNLVINNIKIHCQIVLCPGINDGEILEKTIIDLSGLYPGVISCAVVPVGLTKYRYRLPSLETYDKDSANEVLNLIFKWNNKLKRTLGTNFVYPSDEFITLANKNIPEADYYEGYPQIENGVGMLRKFIDETYTENPGKLTFRNNLCIITSEAAYKTLHIIIEKYFGGNDKIKLQAIKNNFWGGNVNVAGLITASDIIGQHKYYEDCNYLIIPASMLKQDEDVFLDGITLNTLQRNIGKKIIKCNVNGRKFIKTIMEVGMGRYE